LRTIVLMILIRRGFLLALSVLMLAPAAPRAALSLDFEDLGVVFVHGKGVWAGAFDGGLVSLLREAGAKVATPEMPWSFTRIYGATYQQALDEIDAAVADVRARGATQIVVIGHSLGANAAIGYAASHGPLAAVVAINPGHLPEVEGLRGRTRDALIEAAQLVATGQGDVRHRFPDLIQGVPTIVSASPLVYMSMFDPNGPAVMPKNAAAMPAVPFLWVTGTFDPIARRGRDYAFTPAAKNPKSRYVEVFGGHLSTPRIARTEIVRWLQSL
jgi:pimeloyl-ACP methyl ester carboxylesterase